MDLDSLFPYDSFRQGQRELSQSVYQACKNGDRMVAEAMSGFGKTAAVLAGAILASIEEGLGIVYVCRTKRQVSRVMEELGRFQKRLPIRATNLFSKYDYCLLRERAGHVAPETFKWYCSFQTTNNLCTYFLNVPYNQKQIAEIISGNADSLSISNLLQKGRDFHICPYEIARTSLSNATIAVTTYHYLFDPSSRSTLMGGNFESAKRTIAVIDEAHNIREFIAGASSSSLSLSDIQRCMEQSTILHLDRARLAVSEIERVVRPLLADADGWYLDKKDIVKKISEKHGETWLPDLAFELSAVAGVAWYSVATGRPLPGPLVKLGSFLSNLLSGLESSETMLVKSKDELILTNIRPEKTFLRATHDLRSLILLSATINPPDLFLRSIGLDGKAHVHTSTTNYKFRIRTIIDLGVSTRFKLRTGEMYSKMASEISAIERSTTGGIGIFVPSYTVLGSLMSALVEVSRRRKVLVERADLTNKDAEEVMHSFKSTKGSVLIAVQGGRFSEGEDFPGDNMDVSIVVGLSLPPPTPIIYAEYRQLADLGRHQAYLVLSLLPALRKAFQCAGRHVRSPGKVGMVFFLDARFGQQQVIDLMPSWLKTDLIVDNFTPERIEGVTSTFFADGHHRTVPPS